MQKIKTAETLKSVESAPDSCTTQAEARIEKKAEMDPEGLSPEELRILHTIRARQMMRMEDGMHIDNFGIDAIHGYVPLVKRGSLSLLKSASRRPETQAPMMDMLASVKYEAKKAPVGVVAH